MFRFWQDTAIPFSKFTPTINKYELKPLEKKLLRRWWIWFYNSHLSCLYFLGRWLILFNPSQDSGKGRWQFRWEAGSSPLPPTTFNPPASFSSLSKTSIHFFILFFFEVFCHSGVVGFFIFLVCLVFIFPGYIYSKKYFIF